MAGRQIVVDIIGDSKKYTKATDDAVRASKGLGGALDKLDKKLSGFSKGGVQGALLGGVGVGAGIGVFSLIEKGVGKVVDAVGDSINAASDMAEAQSKVNVVFGDQADIIKKWASTSATSMGLAEREALKAAGTLGNLFDGLGLAEDAAVGMSKGIVQLAADLGSFNNVSTDEALTALQSGLLGEAEPMRRFGSALNAARVEAYGFANGLYETVKVGGKVKKVMSEANKVQARYALILQDTKNAQGDFARTAGGLANSQKTLAANLDRLTVSFGQLLLGPADLFVDLLNDLTGLFLTNSGNIKDSTKWLKEYTEQTFRAAEGQTRFNESLEEGPNPFVVYSKALDDFIQQQGDLLAQIDGGADIAKMMSAVNRKLAFSTGLTAAEVFQLAQVTRIAGGDVDELTIAMQNLISSGIDIKTMAMRYVTDIDKMDDATNGYLDLMRQWDQLWKRPRVGAEWAKDLYGFLAVNIGAIKDNWSRIPDVIRQEAIDAGLVAEGFVGAVARPMRRLPGIARRAIVDMKDAIKNGKSQVIEQMRDLAWQQKHPFAVVNYENWLRDRAKSALQKMKQANKNGRDDLVGQYATLYDEITAELRGLPGYAARVAARVLANLDPIVAAGFTWANPGSTYDPGPKAGGGKGGGKGNGRGGRGKPRVSNSAMLGPSGVARRPGANVTVNVHVAPGGDLAEAGRQTVAAIKAYERRDGKGWRAR